MRPVPIAPTSYEGTLADLYQSRLESVLPSVRSVEEIHRALLRYLRRPDAVLPIRARSGDTRGDRKPLPDGTTTVPTDNSPAWAMHRLAWEWPERSLDADAFAEEIARLPVHIHKTHHHGNNHINRTGWYVAHLLRAKPSHAGLNDLTPESARALFIRNVHPANHFYLPLANARDYKGDPRVLAFLRDRLAERYAAIWDEFLALAGGDAALELDRLPLSSGDEPYRVTVPEGRPVASAGPLEDGLAARYSKSRLWFKADVIEPLGDDEAFRVDTPEGSFRMTKAEFYRAFPNVVASDSYWVGRNYHMSPTPKKALPFLVFAEDSEDAPV